MLQEHQQFIIGLGQFGRDWKAIGDIVRTRTAVQIRTHAQKYFQQMEKGRCFPEEVSTVLYVDSQQTVGIYLGIYSRIQSVYLEGIQYAQ